MPPNVGDEDVIVVKNQAHRKPEHKVLVVRDYVLAALATWPHSADHESRSMRQKSFLLQHGCE